MSLLNVLSIGLFYPFFLYLRYALVYSKTQISGKKLIFKGNIFVFYVRYIWWYFLTIITFGIYHFFLEYKLYKWVVNNIYLEDKYLDSYFDKDILESFLINLIYNSILILTLGLGYPYVKCLKYRWRIRNTYISGKNLRFIGDGKKLAKKYIEWVVLTIFTFGLFAIFWGVLEEKFRIENTIFDEHELSYNREIEDKENEAFNYLYLNVNKVFFYLIIILFYFTILFVIVYLISSFKIILVLIDILLFIEFIYLYDILLLFITKLYQNVSKRYFVYFFLLELISFIISLIFIESNIGILLLNIIFVSLLSALLFYSLLYKRQTYH